LSFNIDRESFLYNFIKNIDLSSYLVPNYYKILSSGIYLFETTIKY